MNALSIYMLWEQRHDGPCPACGARMRLLGPEEWGWAPVAITPENHQPPDSYGVLHIRAAHERAGLPTVGAWK